MDPFAQSLSTALAMILEGDLQLLQVVRLSLGVSGTACLLAAGLGIAAGCALAVLRFPGRRALLVVLNTLLALPSVVVGLVVYLLLSRSGPLGSWGLLFTPSAMVVAQTVLVVPVVAALTREAMAASWKANSEQLISLGASRPAAAPHRLGHADPALGSAPRRLPRRRRQRRRRRRRSRHRRSRRDGHPGRPAGRTAAGRD